MFKKFFSTFLALALVLNLSPYCVISAPIESENVVIPWVLPAGERVGTGERTTQIEKLVNNVPLEISEEKELTALRLYFKDITSNADIEYDINSTFYVRNQLLLTAYDEVSFDTVNGLVNMLNADIVGCIEIVNVFQIEFNQDVSADYLHQIIDELKDNPIVEYVSLNTAFEVSYESAMTEEQIETLATDNWNIGAINIDKAWAEYFKAENYSKMSDVNIGIIDSVFDISHTIARVVN